MRDKHEDTEKLLKTYFATGVTPDFAENPKDAHVLKGGLEVYCFVNFFNLKKKRLGNIV